MGYVSKDIICSNAANTIESCPAWVFGILESRLHMAWVKVVCGRMKSDYRYSIGVVYNNFPIPQLSEEQKDSITKTAKNLLNIREKELSGKTFEQIYSPNYIASKEFTIAHKQNDQAVFAAYSSFGIKPEMTDEEVAIILLRHSVQISSRNNKKKKSKKRKKMVILEKEIAEKPIIEKEETFTDLFS